MSLTATTTQPDGIYLLDESILVIENSNYISNTTYDRLVIVCCKYPQLPVIDHIHKSERENQRRAVAAGYGHNNPNRL
jgi:hypothetical protein